MSKTHGSSPQSISDLPHEQTMAAAQGVATEVVSTSAAAVATSTGDASPAQQVFGLLASRFLLLTNELSSATLCRGQARAFGHDEAMTFLVETNRILETPLPILEMLTGGLGAIMMKHCRRKNKRRVKVYALQVYIARANKSVLEFFFNTWQASWAKLFDA